jgi:hypothetical protein
MSGLLQRGALSEPTPFNDPDADMKQPMIKRIDSQADANWNVSVPRCLAILALAAVLPLIAACETTGTSAIGGGATIAGDEKGGKVVGGVKEGGTQQAMAAVTAHCAQYNKKAFLTQMEAPAQGGLMAFTCLDSDGRASPKPR